MASLKGKIALVTGATRDIGRAIAARLAADGAQVIVHYKRNDDLAEETCQLIKMAGGEAHKIAADLEDVKAIDGMFEDIERRFGKLDIYVANAAAAAFKPAKEMKPYNVDRTLAISVRGFLLAVQRVVELAPSEGGSIVGISGIDSMRYIPYNVVKGAAKAAMESMVRHLACEFGWRGIRINAVCPGYIDSRSSRISTEKRGEEHAVYLEERIKEIPLGKIGQPEYVAGAVSFFCSEDAQWITGQTLVVDGGSTLFMPGFLHKIPNQLR